MQVFAEHLNIIFPDKPEEIPQSVSLEELKQEITWRGSPYLFLYRFLAEHDKRLSDLHSAVRGYQFLFYMAFPWLLSVVTIGIVVNKLSLDWNELAPIAGILGGISATINIGILVFRWLRGRRLK